MNPEALSVATLLLCGQTGYFSLSLPFRCIDMIMIIIKLQSVVNNVKMKGNLPALTVHTLYISKFILLMFSNIALLYLLGHM